MEVEAKDRVVLTVRVPADLDQWLSTQARTIGVSKSALIMIALNDARKRTPIEAVA